jgi:hypothetical protein
VADEEIEPSDFSLSEGVDGFEVIESSPFFPNFSFRSDGSDQIEGYNVYFNQAYIYNSISDSQISDSKARRISNMDKEFELDLEHDLEYYVEVVLNKENFLIESAIFTGLEAGTEVINKFPEILFDAVDSDLPNPTGYYPILSIENGSLVDFTQRGDIILSNRQFQQKGDHVDGESALVLVSGDKSDETKPVRVRAIAAGTGVYVTQTDDFIIINATGTGGGGGTSDVPQWTGENCSTDTDANWEAYKEESYSRGVSEAEFRGLKYGSGIAAFSAIGSASNCTATIKTNLENCGSADWQAFKGYDENGGAAQFRGLNFGEGINVAANDCAPTISVDTGCCDLNATLAAGSSSSSTAGVGGLVVGPNYYADTPANGSLNLENNLYVGVSTTDASSYSDKVVICGTTRIKDGSTPADGKLYLGNGTQSDIRYDSANTALALGAGVTQIKFDYLDPITINPNGVTTISSQNSDGYASSPATGTAILGGSGNNISGHYNVIVGGATNRISGLSMNFIGGGSGIDINHSEFSVSVGGRNNDISGSDFSFIGGGFDNLITGSRNNTIGGGYSNEIYKNFASVIAGGHDNLISGINKSSNAIAGGIQNNIYSCDYSFIGAGGTNTIHGGNGGAIVGGLNNSLSGQHGFIGGGENNAVSGEGGVAFGKFARVQEPDKGAFVMADSTASASVLSSGANTMLLNFKSGVYVNSDSGLYVNGNPVMTGASDLDTDTLQTVTDRGATSNQAISVSNVVTANEFNVGNEGKVKSTSTLGLQLLSSTNKDIIFAPNNGSTERMRIKADGDVGIGLTNPAHKLVVSGDVGGTGDAGRITLNSTGYLLSGEAALDTLQSVTNRGNITTNAVRIGGALTLSDHIFKSVENSFLGLYGGSDTLTNDGFIKIHGNSNNWGKVQTNIGYDSTNSKAHWTLNNTTELMTLKGDGSLGIGTDSPASLLHVSSESSESELRIESDNGNGDPFLHFKLDAGSSYSIGIDDDDSNTFKISRNATLGTNDILKVDSTTAIVYNNLLVGEADGALDGSRLEVWTTNSQSPFSITNTTNSNRKVLDSAFNSNHPRFSIFNASAVETIRLETNGDSFFNGGEVGIGTNSPAQKLHLEFTNTDTSFAGGSGGDWGSEGLLIENTSSTTDTMAMIQLRNGDADIHIAGIRQGTNDGDLGFFFEGSEKVRITKDGCVGIGSDNPISHKLDVVGGAKFTLNVDINNNYGIRSFLAGGAGPHTLLRFNSSNQVCLGPESSNTFATRIAGDYITLEPSNFLGVPAEAVRVIDGGNVGIGVTNPAHKLVVSGTAAGSGHLGQLTFLTTGYLLSGQIHVEDFGKANDDSDTIVTASDGIHNYNDDIHIPTSAAVKSYVDATVIPDTNTFVNAASFNTSNGVLTLTRNDAVTVTTDLDGRFALSSSLGTAATKNVGIGVSNVLESDGSIVDDDFLRVTGTVIEGRSASEVLSDIGAQAEITASSRLNANLIGDGSISNTEFDYLDGVSSNIQNQLNLKQATLTFGIADTNAVKIDSSSVADDEFARFTANGLESRSASEVRSDLSLGSLATLSAVDADSVAVSNLETDNLKAGVLDTDLNSVSASDDTLASAKAIKTYVDANAGGTPTLDSVTDNGNTTTNNIKVNTVSGSFGMIDAGLAIGPAGSPHTGPRYGLDCEESAFLGGTTIISGNVAGKHTLEISGDAGGTGFGGRLTLGGTGYLLSGDVAGTESDTLQSVTDRGATTTNNIEIQGAGSKSFTVDSTDGHASVVIDRHSTSYDANLSFQTNGATKWRLWNDSNDSTFSIRDEVNASNVMTWEVGGNVGIGTDDPDALLELSKDGAGSSTTLLNVGGTGNGRMLVRHIDGKLHSSDATHQLYLNYLSSDHISMVNGGGNVGIGSNTPSAKLDVAGGIKLLDNNYLAWNGSNTRMIGNSDYLQFQVAASDKVRIQSDGKVGIGSASPSFVLDTVFTGDNGARLRSTDNHSSLTVQSHASYGAYLRFSDGGNRYWLQARSDDKLQFRPNASLLESACIYFDETGNVGIGVSSPSQKLEVGTNTDVSAQLGVAHVGHVGFGDHAGFAHLDNATTSNYALLQSSAGDTFINSAASRHIYFRDGNATIGGFDSNDDFYVDTDTLYVDASADSVGINDSSPSHALDVNGIIRTQGDNKGGGLLGTQFSNIPCTTIDGFFASTSTEDYGFQNALLMNDLAGFTKWAGVTIKTSGLYKTRGGSAGSYTYSNEAGTGDFDRAFQANNNTVGSWYSDSGPDGDITTGVGSTGVVELYFNGVKSLNYSAQAAIIFGSSSFRATHVKVEALRTGAWQTIFDTTENDKTALIGRIAGNGGGANATTGLRYSFARAGSYFRINNLYAADYDLGNDLSYGGQYYIDKYYDGRHYSTLYPVNNGESDLGTSSQRYGDLYSLRGRISNKFGIGNDALNFPLNVGGAEDTLAQFTSSDNKAGILIQDNDTAGYVSAENDKFSIGPNNGTHTGNLTIDLTNSRVGIGTNAPAYPLDVVGTIHGTSGNFENGITIDGNPVVTGTSAFESDTLQTVTDQGNTTTTSIGLGIASPSEKLAVSGNILVTGAGSAGPHLKLAGTYTTWEIENQYAGGANNDMFRIRNTALGSDALVINRGNNRVGIGTTNPSAQLDVIYGSSKDGIFVKDEAGGAVTLLGADGSNNARARFYNGSHATAIELNANAGSATYFNAGNVGIGTTNPSAHLTIAKTDPKITLYDTAGANSDPNGEITFNETATSENFAIKYNGANDRLEFNSPLDGNTGIMVITRSERVGIGTTAPTAFLDVSRDNSNAGNQFVVADTEGASAGIRTYTVSDPQGIILNHYYAEAGSSNEYARYADIVSNISNGAGSKIRFITKNAANTYSTTIIDNEGRVGIGTSSPNKKLSVYNAGNAQVGISGTNVSILTISDPNSHGQLNTYNDGTFRINSAANAAGTQLVLSGSNVGIGTASPEQPFHVAATNYKPALIQRTAGTNCYLLLEDQNTTQDVGVGATTNDLKFRAGNSDHMKLDAGGDLFLGSPSDSADKLMVQANANYFATRLNGSTTAGQSMGLRVRAGYNSTDRPVLIEKADGSDVFIIDGLGNVGIGSAPSYELDVSGTTRSTYYIGGAYLEENASSSKLKFYSDGTILVMDEDGELKPCEKENDALVFGVSKKDFDSPVVLGAEPVLVTGPIKVGDYIVTSNKQGHGQSMKEQNIGTIIAQAMESGDGESYNIKAMVRKM